MLLPHDELRRFVDRFFQQRERFLGKFDASMPPAYFLDAAVLPERAARFRRAFTAQLPDCGFYYAVKSNHCPRVSEILLGAGFGLDVSSGRELELAGQLGAPDVIFTGPGKTTRELDLALSKADCVTVIIDSFQELQRLEELAGRRQVAIRAGVRLTANPLGLWRKFGIPLARLPEFIEQARQNRHVHLRGLQFHTSWNLTPKAQVDFIADLGRTLAGLAPALLAGIAFVDVGGGYWPETGEWLRALPAAPGRPPAGPADESPLTHYRLPAAGIETFAEQISRAVNQHLQPLLPCRICFEPGRWICNDAMHLLMAVEDKKAPDLVVVNAGINAVGWERYETDYCPILNLSRPALEEKPCDILGSLCTPHDVFGAAYFGAEICPGDILMIPCQGAYTYSLRQDFIKPAPQVIVG